MTISYDDALRERIRAHLAGHDRRTVTDPTKRHAAVAVVLVDSEVGEDRVDPAPVDDWIDGRPMPEAGHERMTIGLPVFRDSAELRLDRLLTQPFREEPAEPQNGDSK